MFYVRKLAKEHNKFKVKSMQDVAHIESDVIKQELGTQSNELSFWVCNDLESINEPIKAIILSSSSISNTSLIIVPSNIVEEYCLETNDKDGITAYKGAEKIHRNICNLTYRKLEVVLKMYKSVFEEEKYSIKIEKNKVKQIINEVIKENKLDKDKLNKNLKEDVEKYCDAI